MTVCLDKSMGGTELCEVNFNMADFKFDEYKIIRLNMNPCPSNDIIEINPEETFLDIGIKGKRAQGLIQASMNKGLKPGSQGLPPLSKSQTLSNSTSLDKLDVNSVQIQQEMELIKKEFKIKKKEYDKSIMAKNTKINDLMTELENTKTDL